MDALQRCCHRGAERYASQYPPGRTAPLLCPSPVWAGDLNSVVSERAARVCRPFPNSSPQTRQYCSSTPADGECGHLLFGLVTTPALRARTLGVVFNGLPSDSTTPERSPSALLTTRSNVAGCRQTSLNGCSVQLTPSHVPASLLQLQSSDADRPVRSKGRFSQLIIGVDLSRRSSERAGEGHSGHAFYCNLKATPLLG